MTFVREDNYRKQYRFTKYETVPFEIKVQEIRYSRNSRDRRNKAEPERPEKKLTIETYQPTR